MSELPSPVDPSGGGARAATPAPPAVVAPAPARSFQEAATPIGPGPNSTLCALGITLGCSDPSAAAAEAATTPAASHLSSWTNITPPTGSPNPSNRQLPAMAYDPAAHEVVLFGGEGSLTTYYRDTWTFAGGKWTELNSGSSCTASTCPSARAGAMMAYDPALQGLILFGGFTLYLGILTYYTLVYNDTWLFSNGTWSNLTATIDNAPSARFSGSMAYDPSDNYLLLFGGETGSYNSLSDTWEFADGIWTNLTAGLSVSPSSRAGASIADSPDGYVMVYGGMVSTDDGESHEIIENGCNPSSAEVAWWFHDGKWSQEAGYEDTCIAKPALGADATEPAASEPTESPPCGRVGAALGWSPKNSRFVLYGGYGSTYTDAGCTGVNATLNDSWTYALPSGGGFLWNNASSPAGPPARAYMGYTSDYSDDYFEIFGGLNTGGDPLNATWRFYEIVYAKLTGPLGYNTAPSGLQFKVPFVVLGYGGSGDLDYSFAIKNTRNSNELTAGPCDWFYNASGSPLPFNGTVDIACEPAPTDYGIYRITLTVTDEGNTSKPTAEANWTFTVIPPEQMRIYSEYVTDFYTGFDVENKFTIYAEVADAPATSISATLGGEPVTFTQSGTGSRWWNTTDLDMGSYSPGATLEATAQFDSSWTDNATYYPTMISTPSWLGTVFSATGATTKVTTQGAGPFNKTYTIIDEYNWSLTDSTSFDLPVPLVGGSYGLIPAVNVNFTATSAGALGVSGTFSLSTPDITIGPASLKVTANLTLTGTFDVVGSGVQWENATAVISVSAAISASIPIYGFSLFGCNVGFTLQLTISPSITLDMILAPLTAGGQSIIPGVAVEIQKFLGSFSLALSAAINFGIGIASIGLGVGLSVAVNFQLNPFSVSAGWVNGSIFVTAQFLWWSDSFNIVGPATIYSWDPPGPAVAPGESFVAPSYNNGTTTKWVVQVEYYAASDYDGNVWKTASSSGPAISDIYPWTSITGAAAYNGADFFYTDDNTSLPTSYGLLISGAHLAASTNQFGTVPGPWDKADYEIASPEAATLPDGNLYVVWTALPSSESTVTSPLNLTSMELQGAVFYPNNDTWGPVRTFSSQGFAQSYQVDATGDTGTVLELVSSQPLLSNTAPERLLEYNLTTGAAIANISTVGQSQVVSLRGASGLAVVESLGGNYSLLSLPAGSTVVPSYTPPTGDHLVSETFAQDSSSTLLLLYRGPLASELVVYDTADATTTATLPLGVDVLQGEGIADGGTTYVFVRTIGGIDGWTETAGTFSNLTTISLPKVVTYGLVQLSSSIVVYSLVTVGGNSTEPIREFDLVEVGAALPAVPVPAAARPSSSSATTPTSDYLEYLGIGGAGVVVLLAVVALLTRRRPASPSTAAPTEGSPSAGTSSVPSGADAPATVPPSPPSET